jgi:flagellar hook-length control protein FliK
MSARVSIASSVSASASVAGGKAAAATGGAAASGNSTADGASAAAAARGSASVQPGPASNPGARSGFSSAMAVAQMNPDGNDSASTKAAAEATNRDAVAADANGAASSADSANAAEIAADAQPLVGQSALGSKASVRGEPGNALSGKASSRSGGAAGAGQNSGAVTGDPVALAMLLAASGLQAGSAGASSVSENAANVPATQGDGKQAASALSGAATTPPFAAPAQTSREPPTPVSDAANAADDGGGEFSAAPALLFKAANPQAQNSQPSMTLSAAGLPELVRGFSASSAPAPMVEAGISTPVASGDWPHAVAAQVHWFVSNDVQSATLRLEPEHLGPVEVHIDVQQSQVNVSFNAAHAETRAALEQTVPRLREIFASGGLTLGQANVQQEARPGSQAAAAALRAASAHAQTVEPVAVAAAQALGLVDEYV